MSFATIELFKALADPVRLRILRAVGFAELSVAELVSVLDMPQSSVSRHLRPLRDIGLLDSRREGTSVFYRRGQGFSVAGLKELLEPQFEVLEHGEEDRNAVRRLMDARKARSREFFDRMAGQYSSLTEPGGGYAVLSAALASGFEGKVVADLGAGEGSVSLMLARFARKVIAVDTSGRMLLMLEEAARNRGLNRIIELARGDLEQLPLADASVDVAFMSQVLHHTGEPRKALAEAARILVPGGRLVFLDLVSHEHEWVREEWADQWLGFEASDIREWMQLANLVILKHETLSGSAPDLPVMLVVAAKPE